MIPKKHSERHELEEYVVEYCAKTMIYRLSILFVVIIVLIFGLFNFFEDDEYVLPENYVQDYDSNLKELYIVEEKSYGDFKSLDENIVVQGNLYIKLDKGKTFVFFNNFKVTKNANLKPALSTNIAGRSVIFLGDKLLGTVGDQSYEIPANVDLNEHRYFILWDKAKNKPISYAELK
jgi:hypothetical protein